MKIRVFNYREAIFLVSLLFSSICYSQELSNLDSSSSRYMIKVSTEVYSALEDSIFPVKPNWLAFRPQLLNTFVSQVNLLKGQAHSLNVVYRDINPQYRGLIEAMGATVSLGIMATSIASPKIKLLKHLQMIIVESENLDQTSLSQFMGIELIEKDSYFSLFSDIGTPQSWNITNAELNRFLTPSSLAFTKPFSVIDKPKKSVLKKNHGNFWALEAIQARKAWKTYGVEGKGVRVMVLDTGVDASHPDLVNSFEKGANFVPNTQDISAVDRLGHGTHVAGSVLGAVYGVAPRAALLAAKVCGGGKARCYPSAVLEALNWALEENVDVLNLSLGGGIDKGEVFKIAYKKLAQNGSLVVAASGNSATRVRNKIAYPAGYREVIAVGSVKAVENSFKRSKFSQYSSKLDIVAPGEKIISTVPTSSFKKVLTLYVKDSKGEEQSMEVSSSLFVTQPKKEQKSFDKTRLVLSTHRSVAGRLVLLFLDDKTFYKESFIRELESLERRGAKAVFFSGYSRHVVRLSRVLKANKFSFLHYMMSEEKGKKIAKALKSPKLSLSFDLNIIKNIHYYKMTGTSMASPQVAGVLALAKALKPSLGLKKARLLLHTSAKSIRSKVSNGVGAGLVQVSDLLSLIE